MEQIKILQISKKIPFPHRDGESVANYALAKGLGAIPGVTIDLLSLHTNKHKTDEDEARLNLKIYERIEFVKHDLNIDPFELIQHSVSGNSYNISRFHSAELSARLRSMLSQNVYDIVLLETIYTTSYIDIIRAISPRTGIILRLHNIEFLIWQMRAEHSRNPAKKILFKSLSKQLKQYTIDILPKVDRLLTISSSDHLWIKKSGLIKLDNVQYQPVGIKNTKATINHSRVAVGKLHIGFIGAMDWDPNVNGLDWFMSNVWQPHFENQATVLLHLAGRNYPLGKYTHIAGIIEHGEVPDVDQFLDIIDVLIAPLFIGSGVRIKILEAMSAGKAVVSTSIGISGIDITNGKEAVIADQISEFIDAINDLGQNDSRLSTLKENAKLFINANYDQEKLSNQLCKLLIEVKKAKTC